VRRNVSLPTSLSDLQNRPASSTAVPQLSAPQLSASLPAMEKETGANATWTMPPGQYVPAKRKGPRRNQSADAIHLLHGGLHRAQQTTQSIPGAQHTTQSVPPPGALQGSSLAPLLSSSQWPRHTVAPIFHESQWLEAPSSMTPAGIEASAVASDIGSARTEKITDQLGFSVANLQLAPASAQVLPGQRQQPDNIGHHRRLNLPDAALVAGRQHSIAAPSKMFAGLSGHAAVARIGTVQPNPRGDAMSGPARSDFNGDASLSGRVVMLQPQASQSPQLRVPSGEPQGQVNSSKTEPNEASKFKGAAVTLDCKHSGCPAKLIIYGGKQKQVVGAHTHVLCQRNCWTCRNFVDAYMTSKHT